MISSNEVKLAVMYIRKSTEDEARQIESFEGQQREIMKYAEEYGYTVIKPYRESYTGTEVKRRKVFLQMLEDARSKEINFNYILCYDISRFGRLDNDEAGYYRHEFRKYGVEVIYVTENLQGDDTDDLIVSTKQWLAREYSRKIGEYVCRNIVSRAGNAKDKARAFNIGRAAPFGYDTLYLDKNGVPHTIVRLMYDRSKEIYTPNGNLVRTLPTGTKFQKANTDLMGLIPSEPLRVETIQKMFFWYVKDNLGQFTIVNRLNEAMLNGTGCPSPTGKAWCIGTVQSMLQNEHYIGNTVFNKRSMGKFFKLIKSDEGVAPERLPKNIHGTIRKNSKDDWIIIEDTHEPLISKDVFKKALEKRKVRKTDKSFKGRALRSKYLFSGKIKCGACGYHYQGWTRKRKGRRDKEGYICGGYKLHGTHVCRKYFLPSEIIEPVIFDVLCKEIKTWELAGIIDESGEVIDRSPAIAQSKNDELTRKLCEIEERLDSLVECITPENKEIISEKMVALRNERERIKSELDDVAAIEAQAVASTKLVGRLVKLANELKELWDVATVSEKKEFMSLMVESVSINPIGTTGEITLARNYAEFKELAGRGRPANVLIDNRGEWI